MTKYNFKFSLSLGNSELHVDVTSSSSAVALRAPSGSGKSTFVRAILGLIKDTHKISQKYSKRMGYVPQDSLLIPHLTVRENLLLSPHSDAQEVTAVAQALGLNELLDRFPRYLSGGEKQRVAIGRAILSKPELLILDEPFSALDAEMRSQVSSFIKNWVKEMSCDLLLVTHDESSSVYLCDDFWTIKENVLRKESEL